MVDSWGEYDDSFAASGDYHSTLSADKQNECLKSAMEATRPFNGRAVIHHDMSVRAAAKTPDGLDFVFIDADHSYEGCRKDIEAWSKKLRPGGLLSGHDYDNVEFPQWGVKRAVDEYVAAHSLELDLGDNFTWFVRTKGELQ